MPGARGEGRGGRLSAPPRLRLAQDGPADALLSRDPFALLVGMLLDQQFPMERAFAGPHVIATRIGRPDEPLDPADIAVRDPDEFAALLATPPAVHRYPASMASRIQTLARTVVEGYGGDGAAIWTRPGDDGVPLDGATLRRRLEALPGFGRQKAQIFVALLGKQLGVRPGGWREAAGPYGEEGSFRSVADVVDADSLAKVRATKSAAKAAARDAGRGPAGSAAGAGPEPPGG